jgi:hypothetical protein
MRYGSCVDDVWRLISGVIPNVSVSATVFRPASQCRLEHRLGHRWHPARHGLCIGLLTYRESIKYICSVKEHVPWIIESLVSD